MAANRFEGVNSFLSRSTSTFIWGNFFQKSPEYQCNKNILDKKMILWTRYIDQKIHRKNQLLAVFICRKTKPFTFSAPLPPPRR